MLLSDLIARLEEEEVAVETILAVGDVGLLARMRAAAEAAGLPLGALALGAVRRYADAAPPEDWATLMGAIGRAEDPAAACLARAFAFALGEGPARPEAVPSD